MWGVANLGKLTPNIGAMPENKKKAINKKIRFIADASIVLFFVLLFLTVVSQGTQVIPEGPTIKDIYTVVNFGLAIFVIFLVILSTYELGKSHGKLDNPAESYFRKLIYLFEVYKLRGVSFSRLF